MKKKYYYWTVILLAIMSLVIARIFFFLRGKNNIEQKKASCQYLNNNRYGGLVDFTSFIDCFGIISIENSTQEIDNKNIETYTIRDDKHDYTIAIIDNPKGYKVNNDKLYIIDNFFKKIAAPDRVEPVNYGQWFYINGEVKKNTYPHLSDIPKYIQVDISTGEVTLYNTYDQMPEEVKTIFKELE